MKIFKNRYEIKKTEEGAIFSFYCDLCYHAVSVLETNENVEEAKSKAKRKFNMCQECKKWVCDLHYNEETMTCVECVPRKMYCVECGQEVFVREKYCTNCGYKI